MRKRSDYLPPREQQIIDLLHHHGALTARQIEDRLPEPLSNSAIRSFLRSLEAKGRAEHQVVDGTFLYSATAVPHAAQSELDRLVTTFFGGSVAATVTALLNPNDPKLTPEELDSIQAMIDASRRGDPS